MKSYFSKDYYVAKIRKYLDKISSIRRGLEGKLEEEYQVFIRGSVVNQYGHEGSRKVDFYKRKYK